MKRLMTIVLMSAAICFNALNAMALESAAYEGTAHTVEDNTYAMMNVLDWNKLEFDKTLVFSNMNSTSSGNLAGVFHINKQNVLGLSWEGNLWSETSYNSLTGFYGWDKYAFTLNFTEYMSPAWYMDSDICSDYKNLGGKAEFGYLINQMFAAKLGLGFSNVTGRINTSDINYSNFTVGAELVYNMKDEENFKFKLLLGYDGDFAARKATVGNTQTETKYSKNVITNGAKLLYKSGNFSYGLNASIPISFVSGDGISKDVTFDFNLSNGFSVTLQPDKLLFNTGAEIMFPSIYLHENADSETGIFYTTFYAGFSFILNNYIKVDLCTGLNPNNGITFDDLWHQNFNISLSARF